MERIPSPRTVSTWPDLDGAPLQASSPAGVGSPGNQSFQSPQTTPLSSGARTPATPPSVPLAAGCSEPNQRVLGKDVVQWCCGGNVVDVVVGGGGRGGDVVVD